MFLAVFGSIVSTPASGDSLFNIDASTNIILNMQFRNGQFNSALGGDWFDPAGKDQTDPKINVVQSYNVPSSHNITKVSTTYSVINTDVLIVGDTTSGAFTITLPDATINGDRILEIKKLNGAANQLTVATTGGQLIDGLASINLTGSNGPSVTVISDSVGWLII